MRRLFLRALLVLGMLGAGLVPQMAAQAGPVHTNTVYGFRCADYVSSHNRAMDICVQMEVLNGQIRADVSVQCLNGANPRQPYQCPAVYNEQAALYKDGNGIGGPFLNCGHDGYPSCGVTQNNVYTSFVALVSGSWHGTGSATKVVTFDTVVNNALVFTPDQTF